MRDLLETLKLNTSKADEEKASWYKISKECPWRSIKDISTGENEDHLVPYCAVGVSCCRSHCAVYHLKGA